MRKKITRAELPLKKIENALWRVLKNVPQEVRSDGLGKEVSDLFWKIYYLREAQEIAAAQRKDKGEVCWTVFTPEDKFGGRKVTTATPRLVLESWPGGTRNIKLLSKGEMRSGAVWDFRYAMDYDPGEYQRKFVEQRHAAAMPAWGRAA